jgi:alkylation response protein AidB-like acyl-CoA dehydrogenase
VFGETHSIFRDAFRSFLEKEVVPAYPTWEKQGYPDREQFRRAGELGFLGMQVPTEYGGGGETSFAYNAILTEEIQRAGLAWGGLRLHTDIVMPYFLEFATDEQRQTWLPRLASGELVSAIAMSEPDAGSDLRSISTRAVRDGDDFVINGAKTFISNGSIADIVLTVVRTDDGPGRDNHSLLVVPAESPGFSRGRRLQKIGLKAQDLAELSYQDVRIPRSNLLGEEGKAFTHLTANLAQERLSIALNSQAAAETALDTTIRYVTERRAYGTPIASFQNTKFELAACATDIAAGRALADEALVALDAGELDAASAAKVKLYCTEMQGRVLDRCLQLFGGYGFMEEYPIAKGFVDARVARIYGGSSEIMKVIIANSLGLSRGCDASRSTRDS